MKLTCNKKLSILLRGITSKNNGDSYCLYWLHYFRTERKCESVMTSKDTKILELNKYQKSDVYNIAI